MKYNRRKHNRKSTRLKGYDYSRPGLYFITICCKDMACLFGHVSKEGMVLNDAGKMVEAEWLKLPQRFNNIKLHDFVVMPNHFHAILEITGKPPAVGATLVVARNATTRRATTRVAPTVGEMLGAFESVVTVEYIRGVEQLGWKRFNGKLLQRNYHDRIIRNERAYRLIAMDIHLIRALYCVINIIICIHSSMQACADDEHQQKVNGKEESIDAYAEQRDSNQGWND